MGSWARLPPIDCCSLCRVNPVRTAREDPKEIRSEYSKSAGAFSSGCVSLTGISFLAHLTLSPSSHPLFAVLPLDLIGAHRPWAGWHLGCPRWAWTPSCSLSEFLRGRWVLVHGGNCVQAGHLRPKTFKPAAPTDTHSWRRLPCTVGPSHKHSVCVCAPTPGIRDAQIPPFQRPRALLSPQSI